MEIQKPDGEIWDVDIEKEYDEDLGIIFENPLMDNIKVFGNKCVFCFIDQMPKGMRKSCLSGASSLTFASSSSR